MKQRASVWIDFYHSPDNKIIVGLECSDPALTFDGHYICLFPEGPNENDATGALERAETMLKYLRGERQFKRS